MARIDYCDPAGASDRTREILDKNRNANIFRMMAHSPSYFEQYCRLGRAIRVKGELDPVLRELAITRTGILCEAPYEVTAHKRIGKSVGVTDQQNAALENWKAATCFDEVQRAALAFTDEIVALHKPADATFDAIAAKLSPGRRDPSLNYFGVDASQPLSVWRKKGWIHPDDPRGWFQWYCRYWLGRRCPDDERQIKRWRALRRHVAQLQQNCQAGDLGCRRRQRQALLHWA